MAYTGMHSTEEFVVNLRDVTALDADAAGTIYGLLRHDDGGLRIVLVDGRQEVLEAQQRQGSLQGPVRIVSPVATQVVRTQPSIDFNVCGLQVAPSGRYAVMYGSAYQDPSIATIALVDLHGGLPQSAGANVQSGLPARNKQCRLHPVDPSLFGGRPGLELLQVSWHPNSEEHLVLLSSDNRLRLYRVTHSLTVAEQTLHLQPNSTLQPQRYGLAPAINGPRGGASSAPGMAAVGESPASSDIVAFAFGPAVGWGLFSMLLLASDGLMYALGPVAPFGMRCSGTLLERLGQEEAAAAEWLEAAFGTEAVRNPSARNRWPVLPHVVEGVSPALVGPLNQRARQELIVSARAISLVASHAVTIASTSSGSSTTSGSAGTPASVSTAVVSFADGRVLAYALAGPWAPAWCESSPQYMSVSGTANAAPSAVRYKCALRPGGVEGPAPLRMVLLDVVELPAAAATSSSGQDCGRSLGGLDDDDDDDDESDRYSDGYGAAAGVSVRRGLSVQMQAGVAGSGMEGAGGAVTVWVCRRAGGCWRITLPWSAMLPRWLGGSPGSSEGNELLPTELPAPLVTCVYDVTSAAQGSMTPAAAATAAGSATVAGSCLLFNPLLGGGLLLLSAAGSLHYLQPAGAASMLLEHRQHQNQSPQPGTQQQQQSGGAATPAGTSGRTPPQASPEQRKTQVEAYIRSVYGNLVVPPADLRLPKPPPGAPSPLTDASPEGLRYLTDCIATFREKQVAFLHGASIDLRSRAEALRSEAGKHAAAVAELSELAANLEVRQEGLEGRISRLQQLHDNLVERAGMLASLHWSLPRALSRAEQGMRSELSGCEGRARNLQAQWETIAARARRVCEERRGGGLNGARGMAARVSNVPEAQLEKVHDAVVKQYSGLTATRNALAVLEHHLTAAVADRTAEQLGKGLGLEGLLSSPAPVARKGLGLDAVVGARVA